jgi:hypothetical protein
MFPEPQLLAEAVHQQADAHPWAKTNTNPCIIFGRQRTQRNPQELVL